VRFDGVRFVSFAPPAGQHLRNPAVISLLGARDGSLWIGTAAGLAQWKNGELFTFPEITGRVNSVYEDRDGTIWIARSRTTGGGVCKVAASGATCYGPKDGVPPYAGTLIGDNLGYLWIGTSTALVRWKPGSSTSYELSGLRSNVALAGINVLAAAPDGSVWAGISNSGRGLGLQQWVNGSWKTLITPTFDSSTLRVNSMHLDRHNALWIGTYETGIYRVHDGNVDRFASADGLSSDTVESFFEDREGNLWLTTVGGVDCFRNIPVVTFSVHEGLGAGDAASIFAARDGTVWIGNRGELDFVRGNVVSSIGPKQGFRGNSVTSLYEDYAGRLWVGLDNGLFVFERGRFTPVHRPDGGPVGIVLAMTEDIDHNVWASVIRNPPGRPTRLICFRDGRFIKEISDQGLDVLSLAADPQSGLWLGLIEGGLARYRNDQVQVFPLKDANARVSQVLANSDGSVFAATEHGLVERRGDSQHTLDGNNGLPCNRIYALVSDKHSDLWLYAECGLIEIKSDDLQRWREHPNEKVKFDLFDAFDGAQPYLPPFRPVATRSNDGRLWFANNIVAQMIDPDGLLRNPIPPPVHIEDVIADRKIYSPQSGLHLPALTRDLEIDYTALSFVVPQKVHFQYRLEGWDRDWQDAGTRRQAFYNNLPPRNYRFRVMACNNSGVWNEAGASLELSVLPGFYQTNWFRSICAVGFLASLWGIYQLRVQQLQRQFNIGLEARVNERTRIARELHDTLLQSFQGLMLRFQTVGEMLPARPLDAKNALEGALDRADQAISEGRDAITDIRASSLASRDLEKSITALMTNLSEELAAGNGRSVTFRVLVEGVPRAVRPTLQDEIYRIARESLRNAFHHAQAGHIEAEITYGESLRLRFRDDGKGIDPSVVERGGRSGHWGLPGIRERAKQIGAELTVWSELGAGTEVELSIPGSVAYELSPSRARFRLFRKRTKQDHEHRS
jgi:signal transduction histidine kinase/ligand-binding sensor domain-containing protein